MKNRLMWVMSLLAVLMLVAACAGGGAQPQEENGDLDEVAPVVEATSAEPAAGEAPAGETQPQAEVAPVAESQPQVPEAPAEGDAGVQGAAELPAVDSGAEAPTVEAMAKSGKYGLVAGPIDDKGFNQLAWEGLQRAAAEFGFETAYSQAAESGDYTQNINELLQQGVDGVVTVGFGLARATKAASEVNPDVPFIGIDSPSQTANDLGVLFDVDEPSFLAGYLAAGMSETGVVCTYGGRQTPPVMAFMVGFENGANFYGAQTGMPIQVLGWQTDPGVDIGGDGVFVDSFTDIDAGRGLAENFNNQGCDVIFPVAGAVGLGSAQVAQERGMKVIGVDADLTQTNPDYADVYLTSVLKKIDVVVYEAIKLIGAGQLEADDSLRNNYIGTLANGGVDLAPFYNFDSQIPQELKDQLFNLENDLIAGAVSTGWPIVKAGANAAAPAPALAPAQKEQSQPAPAQAPVGAPLTMEALANGTYQSDWFQSGYVTLNGGIYREPAAPGSASEVVVSMSNFVAFGDLTGNGIDDAAVVIVTDSAGTGVFVDLAIMVNANGVPLNLASFPLGDRVQVNSVVIQDGEVIVDMIAHGPTDPMCCPSQAATKRFKLGIIEEGADGAGPAEMGKSPAMGDNFVGTYTSSLPAASSPGREITMQVYEDGSAEVSTDYLNGKPPIVEVGTWQDNGDGTFTVMLTGRPDGTTYNNPDVVTFGLQGDELTAVSWDRNVYGSQGLQFTKQ